MKPLAEYGIPPALSPPEYEFFISKRQFTFLLVDDSLVRTFYKFNEEGKISMVRLAYYPHPELKKISIVDTDSYCDDSMDVFKNLKVILLSFQAFRKNPHLF